MGFILLSSCQIGMGPPSYIPERVLQSGLFALGLRESRLQIQGSFFVNPLKNKIIWQGQALNIQFLEVHTAVKNTLWALIPELGQPQIGDTVIVSSPFGKSPEEISHAQN